MGISNVCINIRVRISVRVRVRSCLPGGQPYQEGWISRRVYMGKASPPTRAGSLSRVTQANYIYFPTKPGIRYLCTSYTLTNRACEMKSYPKNTGQDNLRRVYGALTCQPSQKGQLKCVYMENFQPSQARSRQSIARSRQRGLALLSYIRKQILTKNLTETRDLGKEGQLNQQTLFINGRRFNILLYAYKLALMTSLSCKKFKIILTLK